MAQGRNPYELLQEYEQIITDSLFKSLEKNDKVASGLLAQSIEAKTVIFGQKVSLQVYMNDYWKWVDEGRKKGSKQPPQDAMLKHIAVRGEWHVKKVSDLSRFRTVKGKQIVRKTPLPLDKARKTLAFLIGRSIKKHGIKPTNFVEEGLAGIQKQLENDLLEAVGRQIEIELTVK